MQLKNSIFAVVLFFYKVFNFPTVYFLRIVIDLVKV